VPPDPSSITIVVATSGGDAGLDDCLNAIAGQRDHATQVIVASGAPLGVDFAKRHPWVELVVADREVLIPDLWSLGMSRAVHSIVAITTAHFRFAPDYIEAVRAAHASATAAGIGGAINPPNGGGAVAWATYFLRYSAYLGSDDEREVDDFAGDNATYRRTALEAHSGVVRDGFWEQDFHRCLRENGETLRFVPAIRVTQQANLDAWRFMVQRFRHGLRFGRGRLAGMSAASRWFRILSVPLIPGVFFAKIVRRVLRSGRDLGPFVRSVPVLCIFLFAWSLGESFGYALGHDAPLRPRLPEPRLRT
jgi:hypothetical protein